jgi:hypothetical protein
VWQVLEPDLSMSILIPFHVVLFTGDRLWKRRSSVIETIEILMAKHGSAFGAVSGGADGLDTIAEEELKIRGVAFARVDANWNAFNNAAGPIRNTWMLRLCQPAEAHAFHPHLRLSKGTRNMVTQCRKYSIPVTVHKV